MIRPDVTKPYLTDAEKEVLMLVAVGFKNADIAAILRISPVAVRSRLETVSLRFGAKDRTHAVWLCVQHRLLNPWAGVVA